MGYNKARDSKNKLGSYIKKPSTLDSTKDEFVLQLHNNDSNNFASKLNVIYEY